MATSDRPVSSESVCSVSSFQNGDIEFNQVGTSERRLGNESGSPRCIFSYRHSPSITSLSSVCFQREGLPVPSLTLWPECQPMRVYSDFKNSTQAREAPRYSGTRLPGRLATTFCLRNPIMASQQKASEDYSGPRLHSQLGEVRTSSSPGFLFPGGQIQASSSSYRPISGQHCLYSTGSSQASGSQTSLSTSIILHSGSNGVNGQSSTTRESFQEISSVGTQREVVSKACLVGQHYSSRTVVCLGSRSLDRYGLSDIHVSPSSSFSSTPSLHRFELGGLGDSYGQSHGLRLLVHNREGATHQCVRNEGGLVSSAGFCSSYQGSLGVASNGQHHCGSLHKQTGGDSFPDLVQLSSGSCRVVCKEQGPFESQVSTRAPECLSGLPVEERGSCSDRMVAQSKSGVSDISYLGQSTHRSVCHTSEQETSSICISCSGTGGICHRCTESQLGRNVGIRISSFSSYSDMPQKNSDRGMSSMPGSSSLGRTSMVSSTLVSSGGSCNLSSMEGRSVVSTNIQDVASHPPSVPSSRLVAMQQRMQASGISESVARRIYSAKRSSTNNLYDYRWKSWLDWCIGREVDPFNPSVNIFGEFLISLHDKNFSPATVKGYRSAISTTLKQISNVDFSNQSILSDVVRSFELERPRVKPHFPKWDLAVVLTALNTTPFEPLESCGFKELTYKTVFLTALASGRRRSEIHALSCHDVHFTDQSVNLMTFPGFLAKNQLPSVLSDPISLPSLCGQDVNPLLCPVRALRIYLNRVDKRRKGRKRLFISHSDSYGKEISCDTISRWIVQTIKLACGTDNLDQVQVNAHEVRALSSSWAWSNKVPLDDVVKAGFWSSENSFIRFYLRDTSVMASSLASLGPIVAAQAVVVPVTSVL